MVERQKNQSLLRQLCVRRARYVDVGDILGVRTRQVKEVYGDILQRGGRWQEVTVKRKHNNKQWVLKAKESFQGGRRYIVCLNEEQARRDAMVREAVLESLKDALSQGSKSLVGNRGYRKYLKTAGEGFAVDHDKAVDESRYDGKWVLRTSLTKMSAPEIVLKSLLSKTIFG
jgi:hypothetical protein